MTGSRFAPSLALVAAALGLVLACGASGEEEDEDLPAGSSGRAPPPSSRPDGGRPAFDPKFGDAGPDGGGLVPPPPGDCSDPSDQPGSEISAAVLPETDDCDETMKSASGVSKNAVDVDFFRLVGNDLGPLESPPFGCSLATDFEITAADVELCVFARCKNATVDPVTGCSAGTPATSPTGLAGCCASGPGHAVPTWDCEGISDDDSAEFFLRVRQPVTDRCVPYTIRYRF